MPELPPRLIITTAEQFKAIADGTRSRILGIIQSHPATAKQIAERLNIAPGAAGHHLQVLEAAGLARIVAKRQVRGTVAKYYARTARIFTYDTSPEVTGGRSATVEIMTTALHELAETVAEGGEQRCLETSLPHIRVTPARAKDYAARLSALVEDLLHEPQHPDGQVYGVCIALFASPTYLQGGVATSSATSTEPKGDGR
jgi:predicted ArsR family transcriptional regulator